MADFLIVGPNPLCLLLFFVQSIDSGSSNADPKKKKYQRMATL